MNFKKAHYTLYSIYWYICYIDKICTVPYTCTVLSTTVYSMIYCTVYSERKGKLINRGSRFISHLYNVKREFHFEIPRLICVGNFLSFYPFVKNLSKLQKNFIKCELLYPNVKNQLRSPLIKMRLFCC